jgi:hypothetical protein
LVASGATPFVLLPSSTLTSLPSSLHQLLVELELLNLT